MSLNEAELRQAGSMAAAGRQVDIYSKDSQSLRLQIIFSSIDLNIKKTTLFYLKESKTEL